MITTSAGSLTRLLRIVPIGLLVALAGPDVRAAEVGPEVPFCGNSLLAVDETGFEDEDEADLETPDPAGPRPAVDPFRALVVPAHRPVLPPPPPDGPVKIDPPVPPAPRPVSYHVSAIAGESPHFLAVIEYAGETWIVGPGSAVPETGPAAFRVRRVSADRVEVYDPGIGGIVGQDLPKLSALPPAAP